MANSEHLEILETNIKGWNEWRRTNSSVTPDLTNADLSGMELFLRPQYLEGVDTIPLFMSGFGLDFRGVDFSSSNLRDALFFSANLTGANLRLLISQHALLSIVIFRSPI